MKNNMKVMRIKRGDPSSAYGLNPDRFEQDVKRHHDENEALYRDFIEFIRKKNVDPIKFRKLFMRYYDDFIK